MDEENTLADTDATEALPADDAGSGKQYDLDLILDIPLDVRVELGQVKMLVSDLLAKGQGSIIELDKSTNEPLDVYVNNKLVAKGEVVALEERFGIRITDIISPAARIKSLG